MNELSAREGSTTEFPVYGSHLPAVELIYQPLSTLNSLHEMKQIKAKEKKKKEKKASNLFSYRRKICYLPTETGESVEAGSAWQFVEEITGAPH